MVYVAVQELETKQLYCQNLLHACDKSDLPVWLGKSSTN